MKQALTIYLLLSGLISVGQKIKILNFGTFHMQYTPDKTKLKFDAKSDKSKAETFEIAKLLAKFKPTIICVEVEPTEDSAITKDYQNFLTISKYQPNYGGEITLIAYEIGRLAGVKNIYGIDDQETAPYNYNIGEELNNVVDSSTYKIYISKASKSNTDVKINMDSLSTFKKLKTLNSKPYLNYLININADILTYVSTSGHFEGADEASKFYHRNLRIFSNLNQIPLTKNDRVFIIMGAAHTALLSDFINRSPKYEQVNTFEYLK